MTKSINGLLRIKLILLFLFALNGVLFAQKDSATRIFRFYADDDFFNDLGKGTDKAYTYGGQLTLFYNKEHPHFFVDHWMPKAGDSSINTYGIGVMQIMYTPQYLGPAYYQPNDYSYAGAFVAKHSLYSFNPEKNYDLQTEIVAGVIGPAAWASQAQSWLHRVLGDTGIPHGWQNQYRNDLLLNLNMKVEKQVYSNRKFFELIGYGQICAGTMFDALELGPIIRIGKMEPYFNGYVKHFSSSYSKTNEGWKDVQLYFIVNPAVQYVLYSAMLQGGLFTPPPTVTSFVNVGNSTEQIYFTKPKQYIENYVAYISYGPVLAYRHWSLTFTQTYSTRVLKGVYPYIYGNVTLYYSW